MVAEAQVTCPICGENQIIRVRSDQNFDFRSFYHDKSVSHLHVILIEQEEKIQSFGFKTLTPRFRYEYFLARYNYYSFDEIDGFRIMISFQRYLNYPAVSIIAVKSLDKSPTDKEISDLIRVLDKIKTKEYLEMINLPLEELLLKHLNLKLSVLLISEHPVLLSVGGVLIIENRNEEKTQEYTFDNHHIFIVPHKNILEFVEALDDLLFAEKVKYLDKMVSKFSNVALTSSLAVSLLISSVGLLLVSKLIFSNLYSIFVMVAPLILMYKALHDTKMLYHTNNLVYDFFRKVESNRFESDINCKVKGNCGKSGDKRLEMDILYEEIRKQVSILSALIYSDKRNMATEVAKKTLMKLVKYYVLKNNLSEQLDDKILIGISSEVKMPYPLVKLYIEKVFSPEGCDDDRAFYSQLPLLVCIINRLLKNLNFDEKTLIEFELNDIFQIRDTTEYHTIQPKDYTVKVNDFKYDIEDMIKTLVKGASPSAMIDGTKRERK